jgi:hypothetical protein
VRRSRAGRAKTPLLLSPLAELLIDISFADISSMITPLADYINATLLSIFRRHRQTDALFSDTPINILSHMPFTPP